MRILVPVLVCLAGSFAGMCDGLGGSSSGVKLEIDSQVTSATSIKSGGLSLCKGEPC